MLDLNDPRWGELLSGYRLPYDPRSALASLESDSVNAWRELWDELHHQGDVDTAAYAAVPHIVQNYREHRRPDWNSYALVGVIALAEGGQNPRIPDWLEEDFRYAISELAEIGAREVLVATDSVLIQSALGIIALAKGLKYTAKLLLVYDEDEIADMVPE
jgi:hypothetical protein